MKRSFIVLKLTVLLLAVFLCPVLWAQAAPTPRPVVALVLEGGGALGFAHIGVIKVIEEFGIPVDMVIGTSMGAAVGGFYAMGYDYAELERITLSIDWDDVFSEQVNFIDERYLDRIDHSKYFASVEFDRHGFKIPRSLLSGRKMLYYLDRLTLSVPAPVDFDLLPRRFRAVATDISTGERVVIDHGSLADTMRASMGIPGVLAPFFIDGRYLIDGAVVDNLPVSIARDLGANIIIAVNLDAEAPFDPESLNRNPLDTMSRSLEIMIRSHVQSQILDADLAVTVDLHGYGTNDYQNAVEIIAIGETAAHKLHSAFETLKVALGELPPYTANIHLNDQTPIQHVKIEGGNSNDQELARALFAPITGKVIDSTYLEKAVATLESRGSFEYIRLRRTIEESVPTLTVELQKRGSPGHSLQLGMNYSSTYSGSSLNSAGLSSSVVFRGLTTENSRFTVSAQFLDSPAISVVALQPVGELFFVEGILRARQETETYMINSSMIYLQQTGDLNMGINLGVNPVSWAELTAGVRYQWMQSDQDPSIPAGDAVDSAFLGDLLFSVYQFDSPIFPTRGFLIRSRYDQNLTQPGSSSLFRTFDIEGLFMPSLNIPFSFALWSMAGSDFSEYGNAAGAAPLYFKPRLDSRQFFPGPLNVRERIGSHIAGIGTEIKYQLNEATRATGVPSFLLVQASQGVVLSDIADIGRLSDFTHWTTSIGLGSRFNNGFGALLRFGGTFGFDDDFRPFIALDLGSIGNRENLR